MTLDKLNRFILNFLLSDKRFLLLYHWTSGNLEPLVSCVIPVYNQRDTIYSHLKALADCLSQPFEMIIVDDSSSDKSRNQIIDFAIDCKSLNSNVVRVSVYRSQIPLFESRCEDFGFRMASGKYLLGIQADMKLFHPSIDERLVAIIDAHPNIALLSCRGTHSFLDLAQPETLRGRELADGLGIKFFMRPFSIVWQAFIIRIFKQNKNDSKGMSNHPEATRLITQEIKWSEILPRKENSNAGWLGQKIDLLPYEYNAELSEIIENNAGTVWYGETVMRGPIFLRRKDYLQLGGYDTKAFFQGLDDHDLCSRIHERGGQVAFTPIYFSSPSSLGAARKKKSFFQRLYSELNAKIRHSYLKKSSLFIKLSTFRKGF